MVYGGLDLIAMSNALSLRLDSFQAIKSLYPRATTVFTYEIYTARVSHFR